MTTIGLPGGLNRAIVIVKMVGLKKQEMLYSIFWILNKQVKKLTENKIERGMLYKGHTQILEFSVMDRTNMSFARVDYFVEGYAEVIGSDKKIDFTNWDQR